MKKLINFLLMAGIIISTACNNPRVSILKSAELIGFPSGSSIEMIDQSLVLMGDDATHVLVTDTSYNRMDSITIDSSNVLRISKDVKPDYEASTIVEINGKPSLVAFGSGSTDKRKTAIIISLPVTSSSTFEIRDISRLYGRFIQQDIIDLNIEGAAMVGNHLVLANRANQSQPKNTLLLMDPVAIADDDSGRILLCTLILPVTKLVVGVSGLAYIPGEDVLIFTASTEETTSSYADGAIGESYLGIIPHASSIKSKQELVIDELISLSGFDEKLKQQKIESVAVESVTGNTALLHLVADNDDGSTNIFKISFIFK